MDNSTYIKIETLCAHYQVETILINELHEAGVIQLHTYESSPCIAADDMPQIEKVFRLYHDLELNTPAIQVVLNLLNKIEHQQKSIRQLKNKLNRFDDSMQDDEF